jgi:hypothetical protein
MANPADRVQVVAGTPTTDLAFDGTVVAHMPETKVAEKGCYNSVFAAFAVTPIADRTAQKYVIVVVFFFLLVPLSIENSLT